MSQALRTIDISAGAEAIFRAIDEDGGVIVSNFISKDLRDRIFSELSAFASEFETGMPGDGIKAVYSGKRTKRFTGLAARSPSFAEVIDHELLHQWAAHGIKCDYWINTAQAIIIGPGQPAQFLHRDVGNWPLVEALGTKAPEALQSILLAISDFKAETGATLVVPGSHRWEDFTKEPDPSEVVPAVMPAGSALLYTGRVIHAGGANTTEDEWRFGIHMSFVRADLTPEEAINMTTPWSIAQNYPERVQHMLGFYSLRPLFPEEPTHWTFDYRELRDHLSPPPRTAYRPGAGAQAATQETTAVVRLANSLAQAGEKS